MRWQGWVILPLLAATLQAEDAELNEWLKKEWLKKVTPAAVNKAIDKGVAWLTARQDKDGSWGPCVSGRKYGGGAGGACFLTGPTSFSLFTLLKCDVAPKDKVVKTGLKWLRKKYRKAYDRTKRKVDHKFTSYESASLIMMLSALYEKKGKKRPLKPTKKPKRPAPGSGFKTDDWEWMHERVLQLVNRVQMPNGGWRYWGRGTRGFDEDMSATQFCLLALREASRAGYPVHQVAPQTFSNALNGCKRHQMDSGAYVYKTREYPWTAGMTAAGTASMLICKEQIALQGCPVPIWVDPAIQQGLQFLGTVFDVEKNRYDKQGGTKGHRRNYYHYYHLYTLERLGALSGKREFGGKSWYIRGAAFLLREQAQDGSWTDRSCMDPEDVLGTCFALLFLKRATPPTVTISGD